MTVLMKVSILYLRNGNFNCFPCYIFDVLLVDGQYFVITTSNFTIAAKKRFSPLSEVGLEFLQRQFLTKRSNEDL